MRMSKKILIWIILSASVLYADEVEYVGVSLRVGIAAWELRMVSQDVCASEDGEEDGGVIYRYEGQGDLHVNYGVDRGGLLVMKELYGFDRLLSDVLEAVETSDAEGNVGEVKIELITRKDLDSRLRNPKRLRVSATLWNNLLDNLLPVAEAHPYDLKATERGLVNSPLYIPVEGEDRHEPVKLRLLDFKKTREERAAAILTSLTPEQRVALGHPAEYPPPGAEKGGEKSEAGKEKRPGGNPLVRNSRGNEPASGETEVSEGSRWLWTVFGVMAVLFLWMIVRLAGGANRKT